MATVRQRSHGDDLKRRERFISFPPKTVTKKHGARPRGACGPSPKLNPRADRFRTKIIAICTGARAGVRFRAERVVGENPKPTLNPKPRSVPPA